MSERFIRLPELKTLIGFSRTTIYQLMADGTFPGAVKIGSRAVAWRLSEVEAWQASRPLARVQAGAT